MKKSRAVHWFLCLALLLSVLGGLAGERFAVAQEEPPPEEKLELLSPYPVIPINAGDTARFEVALVWQGQEFRTFDLVTTAPLGWRARTLAGAVDQEIPAIGLVPASPSQVNTAV